MNGYNKSELKLKFGSNKILESISGKIKYISGSPFFDDLQFQGKSFDINKRENGIVFAIQWGWGQKYAGILLDDINYIAIEPQEQLFGKTQKSVTGRAAVGWLVAGPLGAVVGGMSGIGSGTKKLTNTPDNILLISYNKENTENFVCFEVTNSNYQKLDTYFQASFASKYKKWSELEKEKASATTVVAPQLSIADELKKLKELLDLNIITADEFEQQKKKLLNK